MVSGYECQASHFRQTFCVSLKGWIIWIARWRIFDESLATYTTIVWVWYARTLKSLHIYSLLIQTRVCIIKMVVDDAEYLLYRMHLCLGYFIPVWHVFIRNSLFPLCCELHSVECDSHIPFEHTHTHTSEKRKFQFFFVCSHSKRSITYVGQVYPLNDLIQNKTDDCPENFIFLRYKRGIIYLHTHTCRPTMYYCD